MAKAKSKNPMGRPRFEVTPKVIQSAEELAGQGLTVNQIATCLGVSPATIYNKQAQYLEFLETIKKGKAVGLAKVTNALFENATVNKDNVAIIYYLNNRDRENWSNKHEISATVEQRNVIDLTRVSDDQLSAITAAFEQSNTGASQGREISAQSSPIYEGSLADD
jgi:predicted transcriptional regulator